MSTGRESSIKAIRFSRARASSECDRVRLRPWIRVQTSYSRSRLEINVSCHSFSGGGLVFGEKMSQRDRSIEIDQRSLRSSANWRLKLVERHNRIARRWSRRL